MRGGTNSAPGNGPGRGKGGDPGGGGGYGGEGANKSGGGAWSGYGVTNGSAVDPIGPGSGGGADNASGKAGYGGGSIWIEVAGTATVTGAIRANGGDAFGNQHEGGGSGGGIYLRAGELTGRGTVSAYGGNARWYAGGGGGGRILISMGLGTEPPVSVVGGTTPNRVSATVLSWLDGAPGTYVLLMDNMDLTVQGSPTNHGTAMPYYHGRSSLAYGTWVTNTVNSPADSANGVRYVCRGWTLTTNGVLAASDVSTQAVFQMVMTNTVLTYLWTNEYELAISSATNGSATTSSNGWYTNGMTVASLQAVPDANYEFLEWSGDVTTSLYTNNPLTVTMDQRRWITAHFGSATTATNRTFAGGNWFAWTNWSPKGIPGRLDTARLTAGNTTLSLPIAVSSLVVGVTATNTLTGWDTILRTTSVTVSGVVTHAVCTTNNGATNRVYILTSKLTVPLGGKISADGAGYKGSTSDTLPFGFTADGQGAGRGKGGVDPGGSAGYGGEGVNKAASGSYLGYGVTYGTELYPTAPGSGGGRGDPRGGSGDGGGSIWIEADDTVAVDGVISATGGTAGTGHSGAGSGGSIYLKAGALGGSGTLRAKGGGGNYTAGGGGGGRIHVEMMSGSALAYDVGGGAKGDQPSAWPVGSNGTYNVTLLGLALFVQGSPTNHGVAAPYPYGPSSIPGSLWITNSVNSPAETANGVRYVCTGWTVTTNGAYAEGGATTQAIFKMNATVTNTVLTYLWTNECQLTVASATNGNVTSASNGWYLVGTLVTGLQATPESGYQFAQWWGDVPANSVYSSMIALTMDRPRTVIAHFVDPLNATNRTRSAGGNWFDWQAWSPQGIPGPKDAAVLSGGSTYLDYSVTLGSLTVTNATLVFTNWATTLTLTGDLSILPNGTVTHAGCYLFPEDMSNRVCIAARNITIDGTINVNTQGYFRGRYPSLGPDVDGQGPGGGKSLNGSGTGGGYGGAGGRSRDTATGGVAYGSATNPVGPGSGGAYGSPHVPDGGGNGGGSVRLEVAETLTLNGTITADGAGAQQDWGGGGSGGAIWITCRRFLGPAGTHLTAKGGITASGGGGGGGGRIAIAYSGSFQYQGTNTVAGGTNTAIGSYSGSPGTYVVVDNSIKGTTFIFR
jgi:hypothetical protein